MEMKNSLHFAENIASPIAAVTYIGLPEVVESIINCLENLREYPIPMNMLHQYMPISYIKVRDGIIPLDPRELALDGVVAFMEDYEYAIGR